jgi:isoamyl acetate esterase
MLGSDGLHFTPAGNKILFYEVVKTLSSTIGFSSECLRSDLPLFHEIDPKDPIKAFDEA